MKTGQTIRGENGKRSDYVGEDGNRSDNFSFFSYVLGLLGLY